MELQQLRYAVAVFQERHFLRAAQKVHISQPTLSQQIKKLEKELGAALFERSPHGVSVTPAGERFLPKALAILDSLEGAVGETRRTTKDILGRVRLAAIPTMGPYILPSILPAIRRAAPALTLELHELTTSVLVNDLKEGRVDLGVLALPIQEPGLAARSLGQEPFYLAVATNHPLAKRKQVGVKDVIKEKLLILQEGHCFRHQTLDFCRSTIRTPNIIFEGSSLVSVLNLAAAGEGITFVPAMAKRNPVPGVAFIPFSAPAPTREIGVLWRVTTPLTRGHELLIDIIEKAVSKKS